MHELPRKVAFIAGLWLFVLPCHAGITCKSRPEELVPLSDLIVRGTVVNVEARSGEPCPDLLQWNLGVPCGRHGGVSLRVHDYLLGSGPDEITFLSKHMPIALGCSNDFDLVPGVEVVAFLQRVGDDLWAVHGDSSVFNEPYFAGIRTAVAISPLRLAISVKLTTFGTNRFLAVSHHFVNRSRDAIDACVSERSVWKLQSKDHADYYPLRLDSSKGLPRCRKRISIPARGSASWMNELRLPDVPPGDMTLSAELALRAERRCRRSRCGYAYLQSPEYSFSISPSPWNEPQVSDRSGRYLQPRSQRE